MSIQYTAKLPLEIGYEEKFLSIEDSLENVKQKLKMILLTNPGEKLYNPEFGIGIYRYIFEPNVGKIIINDQNKAISIESFRTSILNNLKKQTLDYSQDILIEDVDIEIDDVVLHLIVKYNYKNYISDVLDITIGIQ